MTGIWGEPNIFLQNHVLLDFCQLFLRVQLLVLCMKQKSDSVSEYCHLILTKTI
jgi:hypothetical protein